MEKYNSHDTLSDSSVQLPEHTEDYDKDILPSPKVMKCKPGPYKKINNNYHKESSTGVFKYAKY